MYWRSDAVCTSRYKARRWKGRERLGEGAAAFSGCKPGDTESNYPCNRTSLVKW